MPKERACPSRGAATGRETLQVGPYEVELTRKYIKRAYLRVEDATGPVRVSVPVRMSGADVRAFVERNAAWIEGRRALLAESPPASPRRGHVAPDATVLLWGEQVALEDLVPRAARELSGIKDDDPASEDGLRAAVVRAWGSCGPDEAARVERAVASCLRSKLALRARPLVDAWGSRMGVVVCELRFRDMQTRWGTCNTSAHRVWLAVSLAHFPPECLELIVVHELCHLLQRGHGPRFKALMDRFLPDWRSREALLEQAARGR